MSKISKKRSAGNPGFFRTFWGVWNEKKPQIGKKLGNAEKSEKLGNAEKVGKCGKNWKIWNNAPRVFHSYILKYFTVVLA
jgi:hypothetical protein